MPVEQLSQPTSVPLKKSDFYTLNPVNGEAVLPVVTALGDTIFPDNDLVFSKGNLVENPEALTPIAVKSPKIIENAIAEQIPIGETAYTVLDQKKRNVLPIGTNPTSTEMLKNSTGKPITTGVEITLTPQVVKPRFSNRQETLPFSMRNNARVNLQYLDVENGIPSSYIKTVIEDKRGNIWMGTTDAGAICYNGNSFQLFDKKSGLPDQRIRAIYEDHEGSIWFCTQGGVCKYNGSDFTIYNESSGLSTNDITAINEDKSGTIWIGTDHSGLIKLSGNQAVFITAAEGLASNEISSVLATTDSSLWIGTRNHGISIYKNDSIWNLSEENGLMNNRITCLFEDNEQHVWFGLGKGGVSYYDGKGILYLGNENGLTNAAVLSITQDIYGTIWFGKNGTGLIRYSPEYLIYYSEKDGLTSDVIRSIYPSPSGQLWLGTNGGGFCKFSEQSFKHYTKQEGLSETFVPTILQAQNGDLWLGTWGGGLDQFNGKQFLHYGSENRVISNVVRSSMEDSKGNLWFGTFNEGALKFDGETFTPFKIANGLSGNAVTSILEDKNGDIWFGTQYNGATRYDGTHFFHYSIGNGMSSEQVRTMVMDKKGGLWFGTEYGGLSYFDGEAFTYYSSQNGLSSNNVFSLFIDHEENLWIGTVGEGVSCFNGDNFIHYTPENGLNNGYIKSIVEDSKGHIWLATNQGISCLIMTPDGTRKITNFDHADGLKGMDFFANSVLYDTDNNLWWGSGKSLSTLNLNHFSTSEKAPIVRLHSLAIQGEFIDFRQLTPSTDSLGYSFDAVSPFYNYPENLQLNYNMNHLSFGFAAIDWNAQEKIKYSYRLLGFDNSWSSPKATNTADYRNIDPGIYTFEVRSIGKNGIWSESFQYRFEISPPWWHTWWARVLYILLLLASVFGIIRWRTSSLKKRQIELEEEVKMATREIREKQDEILGSITYARRIQSAILPPEQRWKTHLKNSFVLYQPKDIVAGDFYWLHPGEDSVLFAAADCTGHGVPGAMVSVVCNNALNRSVREYNLTDPGAILEKTRDIVIQEFEQSSEDVKDGMDIALCALKDRQLAYSGAHNPLWIIRKNTTTIEEIKAQKQPIGKFENNQPFKTTTIELQEGDLIYLFSDGFADQFGGDKGKKFKTANFKQLLLSICSEPMDVQKKRIQDAFENWRGALEQVDDVCVIGIRV